MQHSRRFSDGWWKESGCLLSSPDRVGPNFRILDELYVTPESASMGFSCGGTREASAQSSGTRSAKGVGAGRHRVGHTARRCLFMYS